jgi:hypothetical protein
VPECFLFELPDLSRNEGQRFYSLGVSCKAFKRDSRTACEMPRERRTRCVEYNLGTRAAFPKGPIWAYATPNQQQTRRLQAQRHGSSRHFIIR